MTIAPRQRGAVVALMLAALGAAFGATPASAKQCVVNKGAFELEVSWYDVDALAEVTAGKPEAKGIASIRPPKQVDRIAVDQISCTRMRESMTAVVTMVLPFFRVANTTVLAGTEIRDRASCDRDCTQPVLELKPGPRAPYPLYSGPAGWGATLLIGTLPTDKSVEFYGKKVDPKWRYGEPIK